MIDLVQIVDYTPEYRSAFADLNKEWISKYFKMEETDYKALDHADAYIIDMTNGDWAQEIHDRFCNASEDSEERRKIHQQIVNDEI
jgi:hypothetical protein